MLLVRPSKGTWQLPAGVGPTLTAMERKFYPVRAERVITSSPRHFPMWCAATSRAQKKRRLFSSKNYVDAHPATLATLPGIRSVMCYFRSPPAPTALRRQTT